MMNAAPDVKAAMPPKTDAVTLAGLNGNEVELRRKKYGANGIADVSVHPLLRALGEFWAPVPWMLEGAIALELVLGKYVEGAVIAILLVFNAVLGFVQEGRAQATLAALKSRLAISSSVRRDGVWKIVAATELVPGDVVKLTLGGLVPADVCLHDGEILVDQSMLTGESEPVEAGKGVSVYAGALIRRGEAVAEVTAIGADTKFGRTAELVRTAHVVSSQQEAVFRVVGYIAAFNGAAIVCLAGYAYFIGLTEAQIVPLILTAVLASIPVALPATFTVAAALGARALAEAGVLPTRLSAVDEAGTMDVLCADKTGTLTKNELAVVEVKVLAEFDEAYVLSAAGRASAEGGQDPVDIAIQGAAKAKCDAAQLKLIAYSPFDPAKRMSEASVSDAKGVALRVVKGALATVRALAAPSPAAHDMTHTMELQGFRVIAVAVGPAAALKLIGLIALSDPPREDSASLVAELHGLGVKVVMASGDAAVTAVAVARAVGIQGELCPSDRPPEDAKLEEYAIFARTLPEDKFKLVKGYQAAGHTVGMCGDGANDAPALRQAQIGIAVSTATDVAKSAAGMVLTTPGLGGIVSAVKEGRIIYQRVLTYTLNSISKKIVQVMFIAAGLVMTGHAILTPLLMAFLMIVGDFLGMSITTDNVNPSIHPNSWQIGKLTVAGVVMAAGQLLFSVGILAIGHFVERYDVATLQTLAFLTLVCGSQATTYNNRERRRIWSSRPSWPLVVSTLIDTALACGLAWAGLAMSPLPPSTIAAVVGAAVLFAFLLDFVKVPVFQRLSIG